MNDVFRDRWRWVCQMIHGHNNENRENPVHVTGKERIACPGLEGTSRLCFLRKVVTANMVRGAWLLATGFPRYCWRQRLALERNSRSSLRG